MPTPKKAALKGPVQKKKAETYRATWTLADAADPAATSSGKDERLSWFDAVVRVITTAVNHDSVQDNEDEPGGSRLFVNGQIARESDGEIIWAMGYTTPHADKPLALDAEGAGAKGRALIAIVGNREDEGDAGDTEGDDDDDGVQGLETTLLAANGDGKGRIMADKLIAALNMGVKPGQYDEVLVVLRSSTDREKVAALSFSDAEGRKGQPTLAAIEIAVATLTYVGTRSSALLMTVLDKIRVAAVTMPAVWAQKTMGAHGEEQ